MKQRLNIKLDLKKLTNVSIQNIKGKTTTKRCIVIPIDDNHIFTGKDSAYLSLTGYPYDGRNNTTHLVKQTFPKEAYQAMTEAQRRATPIVGDIKPWATSTPKSTNPKKEF